MSIDFPCSVHKDTYENSLIAIDEKHLKELAKNGWLTSQEFLGASVVESSETIQKKRGPKPKLETD